MFVGFMYDLLSSLLDSWNFLPEYTVVFKKFTESTENSKVNGIDCPVQRTPDSLWTIENHETIISKSAMKQDLISIFLKTKPWLIVESLDKKKLKCNQLYRPDKCSKGKH